jgi:hypothetical protein
MDVKVDHERDRVSTSKFQFLIHYEKQKSALYKSYEVPKFYFLTFYNFFMNFQ